MESLAHPGGNTTGISILATELDGKRQELLTDLVPARQIAALAAAGVTPPEQLRALEDAARNGGCRRRQPRSGAGGVQERTYRFHRHRGDVPARRFL